MDCIVETCEREAVGKCSVDNGATTKRKPACVEHEGERYTTAGATERYREKQARQRQRDHYGFDNPQGLNPRL
jgi:hypothetical protein